jgi:hypothetical protein
MRFSIRLLAAAAVVVPHAAMALPPLTQGTALGESKPGLPVAGEAENSAPFDLPAGYFQALITNRDTLEETGLPATFGNWDMVAFSAPEAAEQGAFPGSEESIFIPAEVGDGAGVFRYDTLSGRYTVLMNGKGGGNAAREQDPNLFDPLDDEFTRLDPATYTPFGTVLAGEETTGGRLFEITQPFGGSPATAGVRWLSKVPAVAHEGVRFDEGEALYVVDENNSGSIYKYVPLVPGDLSVGQTFVLSVDAYAGPADENWDSPSNSVTTRIGAARWVPITDASGNALTVTDPFVFGDAGTGGRDAADEVGGTPYGRPEDIVIAPLASGTEVLYFTATSEDAVYAVLLESDATAYVQVFVDRSTLDIKTGEGVGTPFNNPDNLAIDADGHVYVIEDQGPPNSDIWQAVDFDQDGVADQIGRFLTNGVTGSEPTGFTFDPNDPSRAIVNVQHPASGNDALWAITRGESR